MHLKILNNINKSHVLAHEGNADVQDIEHDLITDSVHQIAGNDYIEDDHTEVHFGKIRRNADIVYEETDVAYRGTSVTRKKNAHDGLAPIDENSSVSSNESEVSELQAEKVEDYEETDFSDSGGEEEQIDQDEERDQEVHDVGEEKNSLKIYSGSSRDIKADVDKGSAIRNQISIWETLLESRIKLQKCLVACNQLPKPNDVKAYKMECGTELQSKMAKSFSSLSDLLEKLLNLQKELLKLCHEYGKSQKTGTNGEDGDDDDSIASDSGSEAVSHNVSDGSEKGKPPKKKRKLEDYSRLLLEQHEDYKLYRNSTIQKWNDKTKLSSGKMSNSNFSAFDQPFLKQIEEIMSDKGRLIRRTQLNRSQCKLSQSEKQGEEVLSGNTQDSEYSTEIFDDDDFYHKLLRDFIERKAFDSSDPTHLGRKLIELQKLRSKMKRKIDVKATKGRRLRYAVHPKLVNFMASITYNTWSEEAENELYCSLFGNCKALQAYS